MTVVVKRQQMADRLGQVAADRVIPIGNHTIIGGFSLAAFALRTAGPTPLRPPRVPKHVRYQATLLPACPSVNIARCSTFCLA